MKTAEEWYGEIMGGKHGLLREEVIRTIQADALESAAKVTLRTWDLYESLPIEVWAGIEKYIKRAARRIRSMKQGEVGK